jgi:L-ascorbate metabolism protein UlaG (beta-lactamase superfamily)
MDIFYLGHSSFHIKEKDISVVADPFDPDSVGIRFPKVSATVVTVSHDHDDHNKSELVSGVKKTISGPGEYEVEGISILGFSSYHDDNKGKDRGRNTIYVYEMGGLRVCHLGDLGHTLKENDVAAIGDIDVLMVPVGGHFTIGAKDAAAVVHSIEPRIIIPMHYQVPGLNQKLFSDLSDEKPFLSEMGITEKREKKVSLKEGSLPEEGQEVIVLEIA